MADWRLTEDGAVTFLRESLPVADKMTLGEEALARVARHALALRARTPWGTGIPEDIFLPYVLFPRVNNEDPVFYHEILWEALRPRLDGLDMERAALEVNKWCYERATYQSTDGRTANALTVLRRGFGRCGEESTLLVSALRSCGIPARQLYAPFWSHCDDNHAWVEAWVDGTWRYLGACEPELALDSGWFTAAASRAMLVHTRAYGVLPAGERCEGRVGTAYVVNRTAAYARTTLLTVRVTEHGAPLSGVRAEFLLANMAAFRPVCRKATDGDGVVTLLTGLGTLRLWLTDGARAVELTVDAAAQTDYAVDFAAAAPPGPGEGDFAQRAPRETRMQPAASSASRAAAHRRYLEDVERKRAFPSGEGGFGEKCAHFSPKTDEVESGQPLQNRQDPLIRAARGNAPVIAAFLADGRFDGGDARALLSSLREKDLADVTGEVLADALLGALPYKDRYPEAVWREGVLCPRVANEMLYPVRRWLRDNLPDCDGPAALWRDLSARLATCDMEPPTLLPDPRGLLAWGRASDAARDALFVAACRAKGFAARLDPVTGAKQVWRDGAWRPLNGVADGCLKLANAAGRTLAGDADFSVSALENGAWRPLDLGGAALEAALDLPVPPGLYRVMVSAREIDGGCVGHWQNVAVRAGEAVSLTLALPETHTAEKLLWADLPPLAVRDVDGTPTLPDAAAGRPAIVAAIEPGREPTEHLLNELLDAREALSARGIGVWLVLGAGASADNAKLRRVLEEVDGARCVSEPDETALADWRERLDARELRLPLAVALSSTGAGLFAFVNYRVGSVMSLMDIIDAAQ